MKSDNKGKPDEQPEQPEKKKGGLFSFLFEEEETGGTPPSQPENKATIAANAQAAAPLSPDVVIDQGFYDQLADAISAKGKSYDVFTGMLNDLSVIPDEKQRFEAALKALARTSGMSVDELIHALDAKAETLKAESDEFSGVLEDKHKTIQGLTAEITAIDQKIAEIEAEKQRLLGEKKGIEANQQELQEKASKAETDFGNAIKKIQAELREARAKIINFLGGSK